MAAELHGVPHARVAIGLGVAEDYVAGYAMESDGTPVRQRSAAVGAGMRAAPEATAIRAALETVPAGGRFRVAANVLAAEIAAQRSTDDALDVLRP